MPTWFEQNPYQGPQTPAARIYNPADVTAAAGRGGYQVPGGGAASAGIRAPTLSAEDQRLLQDPAFRQQYHAWMMAQGPGAADWATPTGYQQQQQQTGAAPPPVPDWRTYTGQQQPVLGPAQPGAPPGMSPGAWAQGNAYLDQINPGRRGLPRGPAELNAIGWGPGGGTPPMMPLTQFAGGASRPGYGAELTMPGGTSQPLPSAPGGTVQLRAPTGHTRAVPADQAAFYLARGATRL